jgi:hypothetical protein
VKPLDPTPLVEVPTDELLREYEERLRETQTLGVRTRIAHIENELRERATVLDLTLHDRPPVTA